ncbi:MAG: histidinol dehydrogenase [Rhodothermales bacterium]|nr:histidinol dehydrogenase [Rhodothermales bacterium]
MKRIDWSDTAPEDRTNVLARPRFESTDTVTSTVRAIVNAVREEGDHALLRYTSKFDGIELSNIRVSVREIEDAKRHLDATSLDAIDRARKAIELFHTAQAQPDLDVETNTGVACRLIRRPIPSVGLYVPGGTAPLVSSVLMMGVPASIAGCTRIVLCSPPPVNPAILYTASLCGVTEIFQVGGAQAIAAMAYGTESIPRVSKIYGPGNSYVTEAKRQIAADSNGAAIDMVAGPTELMVIADQTAEPDFVAADLLSQAEHGVDSQVVLVTPSVAFADRVDTAIANQLSSLPRREIAEKALQSSLTIICVSTSTAAAIANRYAPEHLIINTADADDLVAFIQNAGSIFVGQWTPESSGDYASGTNHVLPTNGTAIATSGLTLADFQKTMTVQKLSSQGIQNIGPAIEALASLEELEGHRNAVSIRLQHLQTAAGRKVQ